MKRVQRLAALLMIALMMIPAPLAGNAAGTVSYAATENEAVAGATEVTVVESAMELAQESSAADNDPFFTIDVSKKTPSEELATDAINEDVVEILTSGDSASDKKEAIVETLEDSGFYSAEEGSGKTVEVTSNFAYQRLMLFTGYRDKLEAYGAETAVFYKDYYLLEYDSEEATKSAYEALTKEYGQDAVIIDVPLRADAQGWGTSYMKMDTEMATAADGEEVIVAVCDSGINRDHDVFKDKTILTGYNVIKGNDDPSDDYGHGTQVAGIIAESTPSNVCILPIKVLSSSGSGSIANMKLGVEIAEENGADIINLSLGDDIGSSSWFDYCDELFSEMDALIVCAAGNDGMDLDSDGVNYFPCELSSTLCVGAFDEDESISYFSNYGGAVDFAAPGESLKVAKYQSSSAYTEKSGTSYATPYVAAAAALIKAEYPDADKDDLVSALKYASEDMGAEGCDIYFGNGCPKFPIDLDGIIYGDISQTDLLKISGIKDKVYTGFEITQDISVKICCVGLVEGTDYTVEYEDNVDAGTAVVRITGIGSYTGSVERTFAIEPKDISSLVSVSQSSFTYDGSVKKPEVSMRYGDIVPVAGTDYDVTYSGGCTDPGTYTVTVTGKGNYTGSVSSNFTINYPADIVDLPAVKIAKPSAGKKKLTAKWKAVSKKNRKKIGGIEIQIVGNGINEIYQAGKTKKSKVIKGLVSKKKYKVRVRAYRYDGYYKHVSKWSGYKKIKVK